MACSWHLHGGCLRWLDCREHGNLARLMNDECRDMANLRCVFWPPFDPANVDNERHRIFLVATKDIPAGVELTWCYGEHYPRPWAKRSAQPALPDPPQPLSWKARRKQVDRVAELLDERRTQAGTKQYLVRWEGQDSQRTSWEVEGRLEHAKNAILEFEELRREKLEALRKELEATKAEVVEVQKSADAQQQHAAHADEKTREAVRAKKRAKTAKASAIAAATEAQQALAAAKDEAAHWKAMVVAQQAAAATFAQTMASFANEFLA